MARATFVKEAKKPIYKRGKRVEYVSKRGKRAGQTLTKLDRNQPADENDEILINVGDSYWTWCFYGGNPIYSKTKPKQSQLTQNWFKSQLYEIIEKTEEYEANEPDDIESLKDELLSDVESLRDETQEHLDNMPEQLHESDSGQILQDRIDNLDEIMSTLENIDTDFNSEIDREDYESDEEYEDALSDEKQEWIDGKMTEIQEAGFDFE